MTLDQIEKNSIYGSNINDIFVKLYQDNLNQLSKEDLIKIIAILKNANDDIGMIIQAYRNSGPTIEGANLCIDMISNKLSKSNIPFYQKVEDLKEDINNRYNG